MKSKFILLSILALLISGCSCPGSRMDNITVVRPDDSSKNCKQLLYSIEEAEFMFKYTNRRYVSPHVFDVYPICIPVTQSIALKNKFILEDRIDYLNSLYDLKDCRKKQSEKSQEEVNVNHSTYKPKVVEKADLTPTKE